MQIGLGSLQGLEQIEQDERPRCRLHQTLGFYANRFLTLRFGDKKRKYRRSMSSDALGYDNAVPAPPFRFAPSKDHNQTQAPFRRARSKPNPR